VARKLKLNLATKNKTKSRYCVFPHCDLHCKFVRLDGKARQVSELFDVLQLCADFLIKMPYHQRADALENQGHPFARARKITRFALKRKKKALFALPFRDALLFRHSFNFLTKMTPAHRPDTRKPRAKVNAENRL
jgi:hypothetical protein